MNLRRIITEAEKGHHFTIEDARKVVEVSKLDVKNKKYDISDICKGMNVEVEHGSVNAETDVVPDIHGVDNPVYFAKIAIAHLEEDPEYYKKLQKIESD